MGVHNEFTVTQDGLWHLNIFRTVCAR